MFRQQALLLQHVPEGRRRLRGHRLDIGLDALWLAGAKRQGHDAGMRLAELDADLGRYLAVLLTEREEFLAPGEFLLIGRIGRIELDVIEELAAGQEAGAGIPG